MTACALSHLRHALTIEINFADAFDAREHVINRLTADANQVRTHDPGHEIAREIEDFLRGRALEAFAKNRGHRAGKRLHLRAERHADVGPAVFVHMEIHAHRVGAFLVFSYVDQVEFLVVAGLLLLSVICIGDERLAPFIFRQRCEEIDDLVQLRRIHQQL